MSREHSGAGLSRSCHVNSDAGTVTVMSREHSGAGQSRCTVMSREHSGAGLSVSCHVNTVVPDCHGHVA